MGPASGLLKLRQKGSISGPSALESLDSLSLSLSFFLALSLSLWHTHTHTHQFIKEHMDDSVTLDVELLKLHLVIISEKKPKKRATINSTKQI